jgi:putative protease
LESTAIPIKPGDGVVFDTGGNTEREQGGRVFQVQGNRLFFETGKIRFHEIPVGSRVWKTSDPALDRELRGSFSGRLETDADRLTPLDLVVRGKADEPLLLECGEVLVSSRIPLQSARTRPLTTDALRAQLEKLGGTGFSLRSLESRIEGDVILPISEINRMRRELVEKASRTVRDTSPKVTLKEILPSFEGPKSSDSHLSVLVRSEEQLEAALEAGAREILVDYEDIRRYKDAVAVSRAHGGAQVLLATPRIQKAGEEGFFKLIANANPDGVLIRNIGAISHFAGSPIRLIGDFSLNVANPLTALVFKNHGLERLTISHDLNSAQILSMLRHAPPEWFELTLHHHMPMFHMEHCVFAAFLSKGKDYTDCGRPCEKHRVHLRDRVGMEHPLRADVGCRNTLFHATAQTGAAFFESFHAAGLRHFRIELLEESAEETTRIVTAYQELLTARRSGAALHCKLHATSQIGVTTGTYSG